MSFFMCDKESPKKLEVKKSQDFCDAFKILKNIYRLNIFWKGMVTDTCNPSSH